MNAIKFIQQHGVDKAMEVVDKHHECYMPEVFKYWSEQLQDFVMAPKYASCLVSDLKRLVYSVDLVKEHYTLDRAIEYANSSYTAPEIKVCLLDAIADYKSIYGGEHV